MRCPYLKEGNAQYCHAAPVRKLILDGPASAGAGRCSSHEYRKCEWADQQAPLHEHCPLLEQVSVQYCAASPVTKLVPCSESQLSRCASGGYQYCDSYLSRTYPHATAPATPRLFYAPNHFWLDLDDSGLCHVGIDSFLAEMVGSVEAVTFATRHGTACPAVVLTVHGVEWPMNFPNPLMIQRVNSHLGSEPSRLTSDPYGAGWLFEGWEVPDRTRSGLIRGAAAAMWRSGEAERLTHEIRETCGAACDGGLPVRGVAGLVSRQALVCLFQHFFARRAWPVEE